MIAVTGAAGFIGSCVVAKLNELGHKDLICVDEINDAKAQNLKDKKYKKYYDKDDFISKIKEGEFDGKITTVIHMGACSSTTLTDPDIYEKNNFQYSKDLAEWTFKNNARFIYASSAATYGNGSSGYKDDIATIYNCKPLNLYGESKQNFDLWILDNNHIDQATGLKFFNVFGPNEYHKEDMRSVVAKAYEGVVSEGVMRLFKSYNKEYADGEQKRDFIYVKDAVGVVLFFFDHPEVNGIYNVGTGHARTWNDLARALFTAVDKDANIEYIDMPENLKNKYQYFTEADMMKLREAGYDKPFTSLEDAVKDYAGYLKDHKYW